MHNSAECEPIVDKSRRAGRPFLMREDTVVVGGV
jgi:hypothetical protein